MRVLRIITTVLVLLWGGIFMILGSTYDQAADAIRLIAGSLTALTIWALYTRPEAQEKINSIGRGCMLFIRGVLLFFVWAIHILFCMIFLAGGLVPLVLPSLFVFVVLFQNSREIKSNKPETKKQKHTQIQQANLPKDENLAAQEMRTYYAAHQAEIDAMLQTFRTLLVEKHGMREDFVMQIKHSQENLKDLPISIRWHMFGTTAAEEAQKLCDTLYFSADANNPAIFAKHMTTGEDLPADYEYDHWATRNLGHSTGQRVMMIGIFAALGCNLYTIYGQVTFVASGLWQQLTIGISLALTLAFLVQSLKRFQRGDIRTRPGRRKLKKWDLFWLMPFCAVFCWFMIGGGVGATLTAAFGTTHEAAYAYKKIPGKNCVTVEEGFPVLSRFCVPAASFQRMEKEGRVFFKGKKSWFGESLEVMY